MGIAAACSKDRFAGLRASWSLRRAVLGEGPVAGAVDVVARLELRHVLAHGLDRSREGPARVRRLGRANAEAREADRGTADRSSHATCLDPRLPRRPAPGSRRPRSSGARSRRVVAPSRARAVHVLDDRLHRLRGAFCRLGWSHRAHTCHRRAGPRLGRSAPLADRRVLGIGFSAPDVGSTGVAGLGSAPSSCRERRRPDGASCPTISRPSRCRSP